MRKGKGYVEEKKGVLMGFWRSIGDGGEDGNRGGLKTQQDQSQEGKESRECSSCTCGEGQGGCDRKRLWGIAENRGGDLKGWWVWIEKWWKERVGGA